MNKRILVSEPVFFVILSVVLVGNISCFSNNGLGIPMASAQVPSQIITNQGSVLTTTTSTSCSSTVSGQVLVSKIVTGSSNINTALLPFTITVTDNGQNLTSTTITQTMSPKCISISVGHTFSITETGFPPGFSFSAPTYNGCTGTVTTQGQSFTCTITNTLLNGGTANPQGTFGTPSGTPTTGAPGSSTATLVNTPTANAEGQIITPSTSSGITNPPFQSCQANQVTATAPLVGSNNAPVDVTTLVRAPSSQTIVINGIVPLDQVKNAMMSLGTNQFTIEFIQNLAPQSGVITAIANPPFAGKVIVQDDSGLKQKIIDFNVQNSRTECKFITLAKAQGPATNANVVKLGQLGNPKPGGLTAPDINKLLFGAGPIVQGGTAQSAQGLGLNNGFAVFLNPPFAQCITATDKGDTLALYNIRGEIPKGDVGKISGHSLLVEITSDIVQNQLDQAKILNNNNQFVKVNLISNAGQYSVRQIDFTLSDLWTDCKAITQATQSIFSPLPGEIYP